MEQLKIENLKVILDGETITNVESFALDANGDSSVIRGKLTLRTQGITRSSFGIVNTELKTINVELFSWRDTTLRLSTVVTCDLL